MKPYSLKLALTGLAALATFGLVISQGSPAAGSAARGPDSKLKGATSCKACHSKDEIGNQYGKWESSKHFHAFEVLGTPEAKELAKAKGIDDPQKADACLKCHVTGFGMPEDMIKGKMDEKWIAMGVQCESCHGGGDDHIKARMKAAMSKDKPELQVVSAEEIVSLVPAATCKKCHNEESPSYKPFCYHKFTHEISHLNPTKDHGEPKMGCDDPCTCKGDCTHKCKS